MKFTFLTKGLVKESTDIISHEKQGSFNLTKWFKKLLSYFNVPFADPCCSPEANRPVRLNSTNNTLESYDSTTNTWVVSTIGGGESGNLQSVTTGAGNNNTNNILRFTGTNQLVTSQNGGYIGGMESIGMGIFGSFYNGQELGSLMISQAGTELKGGNSLFVINHPGGHYFYDLRAAGGIQYGSDYSANYTNRSLVDKEYVDSIAGSGDSYIAGTGMRINNGVINLGLDLSTITTTKDGALTEDLYFVYFDTLGSIANTLSVTSQSVAATSTNLFEVTSPTINFNSQYFTVSTSNIIQEIEVTPVETSISFLDSSHQRKFKIDNTGAKYIDGSSISSGIQYGEDYSANYTERSLVDKSYVDSVSGGTLQSITTETGSNISSNALQLTGQNNIVFEDGLILGYNTSAAQIVALFNNVTAQSLLHLTPTGFTIGVPAGLHLRTDGVTTPFIFENNNIFERVSAANATQPQDLVPLAQVQQMIADNNIEVNTYAQMIASIPSVQHSVTYLVLDDENKDIENTVYKYFKNSNTLMWIAANKEII